MPAAELTREAIVAAVKATMAGAEHRGRLGTLSIALMDDATLAMLHGRYLNDPSPTDVITFDLRDDPDDPAVDGEILISVERARAEAARRRLPVQQELLRYVIHGTLHLLGLDDATPAGRQRMRRAEDRILKTLSPRLALSRATGKTCAAKGKVPAVRA